MKRLFTLLTLLSLWLTGSGQETFTVSGQLTDAATEETLIGSTVVSGESGTVTDINGNYSLQLPAGEHTILYSYVGYDPQSIQLFLNSDTVVNIQLDIQVMKEVLVTADIAIDRKTPVAYSNVPTKRIEEELVSQDLPMILNTTPGIYATQQGGGDGDARVTIRGFSQNNIAVMLDGVPVNDMENGNVFWSNWFGLDMVTQSMQVQRGLGASKLSIPAVGGTINILTKGIESKRQLRIKQEVGNDGFLRTSVGFNSGRLKNGFGFSAAASYKEGDGWVDGNFTRGAFYYLKAEKQFGDHLISLSGFGAPQEHGQRSFKVSMATIDTTYALERGIPVESVYNENELGLDRGLKYNQHTGIRDGEVFNTRQNRYHKPQITLRHSWQINSKLFLSNVAYMSIGRGGGIRQDGDNWGRYIMLETGTFDIDSVIRDNRVINFARQDSISERFLSIQRNEHYWYGLLSTFEYSWKPHWSISGGLDFRYYKGDHYKEVHDLLGGEYLTFNALGGNFRIDPQSTRAVEGDIINYNDSGFVGWGGAFGLLEYDKDRWSWFMNLSGAQVSYAAEDYFIPKVVELADTTFKVGYGDTIAYQDQTYHLGSPQAKDQRIDWIHLPTFTLKTGFNYLVNDKISVFSNIGYFSKPPRLDNVIDGSRTDDPDAFRERQVYENEQIRAFELGGQYRSAKFTMNINTYYTDWINKPLRQVIFALQDPTDPESPRIPLDIPGIDARHIGVELDFAYRISDKLTLEGLVSVGDWIWNSEEQATFTTLVSGTPEVDTFAFDARGVHVGDAAQTQIGAMLRYQPFDQLYLKGRITHFARHFSDFEPEDLKGPNGGREVYQSPAYSLVEFHAGYFFRLGDVRCNLRGSVLNALDAFYISDSQVNNTFTPGVITEDFDAKSTAVHFGQGRRWNVSLTINL